MANHASAEKRNRQRVKRTDRNRTVKSSLRTAVKKVHAASKEAGAALYIAAESALDRAATKGVIPFKRASRVKSRLALALVRASKEEAVAPSVTKKDGSKKDASKNKKDAGKADKKA